MDIIRLLPDNVANQIAAGEVIQRPASVVKELVENSIDAGAKLVTVIIKDAGRTLIEVIDDGKGMSATDARMSFERHATSKICEPKDLFALTTMGFRGEALASIAAVAQVELITNTSDESTGTQIIIEGSHIVSQKECSAIKGTTFKVRNLFYNVPARRKFLKSDETEMRNIIQEMQRMILAHNDVAFKLYSGDDLLLDVPIDNFKMRIINLFGRKVKKIDEHLMPIDIDTDIVKISGYVGVPSSAGKNTPQFFFVNNRYMYHPYFRKAIVGAYDRMIAPDTIPPFFVNLEVEPSTIDVNIHPTKTEIKFENERDIWQLLNLAVRNALGKFNIYPSIDFDTEGKIDLPPKTGGGYNPFEVKKPAFSPKTISSNFDWKQLMPVREHRDTTLFEDDILPDKRSQTDNLSMLYKGKIICVSMPNGLMFIDVARAVERVYYDDFLSYIDKGQCGEQILLFGEKVALSVDDICLVEEIEMELKMIGFNFEKVDSNNILITSLPAVLPEGVDVTYLINNILANIKEGGVDIEQSIKEAIVEAMALSVVKHKTKIELTPFEWNDIMARLFATTNPHFSPKGEKIISILNDDAIDILFQ